MGLAHEDNTKRSGGRKAITNRRRYTCTTPCRHVMVSTVEEQSACFIVRDHNGQALAYVYFEDEPGRRSAAKLMRRGIFRGQRFFHILLRRHPGSAE